MEELRRPNFRQAALFAILLDGILLVLGWLWIGPPQTMGPIASYKLTAIIGLPTITQLLEARHQFSVIGFQEFDTLHVIVTCLMYVVFLLASAYYIGMLARTKRELPTPATQDAKLAWPALFLWMVVQLVVMAVLSFVISTFGGWITHNLGNFALGALMILVMLGFRFWFLYVEYAAVVLRLGVFGAMRQARRLLSVSKAESFFHFLTLCIVSFVLAYAVNRYFNVPVLMGVLVVNGLVQTWLQMRLMEGFFRAVERLQG
ncbi:hypothetical protein [Tumebacillus flagellatus]|uniref:DUF4013 domain-containing protein n=1 Tax=Tumebacillus flagellatus TaxID=1157490 RepID=A0A074LFH7_9BACL|nr:hypothetical protein [Tumebacillus flagellatus]KEO80996.1 hypothetical protein EL26_23235 [Tumebacillus flagellatus]